MEKNIFSTMLVAIIIHASAISAFAGFAEGVAAFNKGEYETAVNEYKKAADEGDVRAQRNLGLMYETGAGVQINFKEALRYYRMTRNKVDKMHFQKQRNPPPTTVMVQNAM